MDRIKECLGQKEPNYLYPFLIVRDMPPEDYIEEIEMASPWTFCNFLGTPQGTVYGYEVNDWDTMVARLLTLRKEQPIHGFKTCGAAGARGDGFNQTYLNGNDMAMLLLEEMEQDAKEGK